MKIIESILNFISSLWPDEVLTYREKIINIATDMRLTYGLNHDYVVCDPGGSGALLVFKVKKFEQDHFVVESGAIYSYHSLGGYFMPPVDLATKIRAAESNLKIARVN